MQYCAYGHNAVNVEMRYPVRVSPEQQRQKIIKRIIDALRTERLKQGLSQNKLAELSGIDHTMVLRVEKQERMPTIDTLLRMAGALKIELGSVITDASSDIGGSAR